MAELADARDLKSRESKISCGFDPLPWHMCLGIPGKVIKIKDKKVKVDQGDHCHWLDISLIDDVVKLGDYLLSYQHAAINKISKKQALEVLKLLKSY